jgi:hypothetical protein
VSRFVLPLTKMFKKRKQHASEAGPAVASVEPPRSNGNKTKKKSARPSVSRPPARLSRQEARLWVQAKSGHSYRDFGEQHQIISNQIVSLEMEPNMDLGPTIERGQLRLATVRMRQDQDGDDMVQQQGLDFFGFEGSRLSNMMNLYERWRFLEVYFEYVPTVPTTQAGTVVVSPEYDPQDVITSQGDTAARALMQSSYAREGPLSGKFRINMPPRPDGDDLSDTLWCAPILEPRLCSYGRLRWIVQGASGMTTEDICGYIVMHYRVRLFIPQLDSVSSHLTPVTSPASLRVIAPTAAMTEYGVPAVPPGSNDSIRFADSLGTTDVPMTAGRIVRAVIGHSIGALGRLLFHTNGGGVVGEGAPIWAEVATAVQNAGTKTISPAVTTPYIMRMWTGGLGDSVNRALHWYSTLNTNSAVELLDPMVLTRTYTI